ncbi:SDR family NAD(P)-dependent oxidoreductase [Lutimonas sp.]|uniref:SDR family NAD(P)-dependent oxidoreductase n=1 Tax=Lutimonas sp. TaxID=1872403 RepID=UPI003D9B31D0
MKFNGKTLWITGASSGIGRAVAIEFSYKKCHLILSSRNKDALEEVRGICEHNGSSAEVIPLDLGNSESIVAAVKKAQAFNKTIDGLYHFGGISQRSYAIDTDIAVERKIFEVNFFGTIELSKMVLPIMIGNGGGQIGVTSSIVGKFGFPYRSSYAASKHALHGYFESLRAENVAHNILISMLIPGRVKTNISMNALDSQGKAYHKMDDGQNKGMSAEKAGRTIVNSLGKERKEILIGGSELLMVQIRRFLPRLFYYLSTKVQPL